jgi:cysteinyl-tRNA synthetase
MTQRVFNTLTQTKEELQPLVPGKIGMYVCGPTVYDMSHAGHARCYTVFDTVARWLRASGLEVRVVRNYTDVDDKIIRRANEQGKPFTEITERFIGEFQTDMRSLNVGPADVEPKVSEHIPEIVALVARLVERGVAYESQGDVYFAVKAFAPYGRLSKRNLDDLLAGARVEPGDAKRVPLDFALWKAAKPGEPSWDSPWGKGRPGWHIECSAMSAKYLGDSFDIHGGGKDLVFPHHENEIAQSEAASGVPLAKVWLHNGFVTIHQEKMAKSLGNFFTIRELLARFDGESVRYFLLGTHYRSPIDFSLEAIAAAESRVAYVYETLAKLDARLAREKAAPAPGPLHAAEPVERLWPSFAEAMEDDFNTAAATGRLSDAFALANELCEKPPKGVDKAAVVRTLVRLREDLRRIAAVLGVFGADPAQWLERYRLRAAAQKGIDPAWVEERIRARTAARGAKDFAAADAVRDELKGRGVEIMDTPGGTTWRVLV